MSRTLWTPLSLAVVGILAAASVMAGGCETAPATGKSHLNLLSRDEEVQLGSEAVPQFLQSNGGDVPSQEVRDYVTNLGMRLAKVTERPDLPWEFHVVDSSILNAFALPGGKVFVTRGLLAKMQNEAQLAGVLGHECGHVAAEHIEAQMGQQLGIQVIGLGVGLAGQYTDSDLLQVLGVGVNAGGALYQLHFSRSQESEADELGVRYMSKLGYNPVAQIQVMQILKENSGGGDAIEMLQTHPLPDTRIDDLQKLIKSKYPDADQVGKYVFDQDSYQQHVLAPLSKLPPPKSNGQEQTSSAAPIAPAVSNGGA